MGLNLRTLIHPAAIGLGDLAGDTVAVDAYGMFYQFLTTLRDSRGRLLTDDEGNTISHLIGLVSKTQELLAADIRPVFVFDGPPHPLKMETLRKRAAAKDDAKAKLVHAIEARDAEAIRRLSAQTTYVTDEMVASACSLLEACGLPYVMAPQDGEAQCAALAASGRVDAAASQDYDTIVYGSPRTIRNLTSTKRDTEEVLLASFEIHYGIGREQLIDLAILVGNDFHDGIRGVGPKTGLKLVAEHGSLDGFLDSVGSGSFTPKTAVERKVAAAKHELESDLVDEVRCLFRAPPVLDDPDLKVGNPDATLLHERLHQVHGFTRGRSDTFATTVVEHFERWNARAPRTQGQTQLTS